MRSLASETSRELTRRIQNNSTTALWLEWFGASFNQEHSALEPHLLPRQINFATASLSYLYNKYPGSPVIIIAHSMGGIVGAKALQALQNPTTEEIGEKEEADSKVIMLLTLGTPPPPHPQFMPAFSHFNNLFPSFLLELSSPPPVTTTTTTDLIPVIDIAAAPTDIFYTSRSLPSLTTSNNNNNMLSVGMQYIPSVWTGASHSGIVSCNQLVRVLSPLLIDAAALHIDDHRNNNNSSRSIMRLAEERLIQGPTFTAQHCNKSNGEKKKERRTVHLSSNTLETDTTGTTTTRLTIHPKEELSLVFSSPPATTTTFTILASASPPCSPSHSTANRVVVVVPLPPMEHSLRNLHIPRSSNEILHGIDWYQNATWLITGINKNRNIINNRIELRSLGDEPSQVIVQRRNKGGGGGDDDDDNDHASSSVMQYKAWTLTWESVLFPHQHDIKVKLQFPPKLFFFTTNTGDMSLLPLTLHSTTIKDGCTFLPALIFTTTTPSPSGQYYYSAAAASRYTTTTTTTQEWELYSIVPYNRNSSTKMRVFFLITDPECEVKLVLKVDLIGWLGSCLRRHALSIPVLAAGLYILPLPSSSLSLVVICTIIIMTSWYYVGVTLIEACGAIMLAVGWKTIMYDFIGSMMIKRGVQWTIAKIVIKRKRPSSSSPSLLLLGAVGIVSTFLHPTLPLILGSFYLLSVSAPTPGLPGTADKEKKNNTLSVHVQQYWSTVYSLLLPLAITWLFGSLATWYESSVSSGYHDYKTIVYSLLSFNNITTRDMVDRIVLGVLGCHAAFLVPTIHHNNNNNNNYELNKKLSSSSNGLIAGGVIMALVTATLQVLGGVVGGSMVIIHAFQGVYYTPIVVVLVLAILNIGLVNLRRMASRLARNNNSSTGGRKDKGA